MNGAFHDLAGQRLALLPSGALWWPGAMLLAVADLHLGRSERMARRGAGLVPPYDTAETLDRLEAVLREVPARTVVCVGDSFDDLAAAAALSRTVVERLAGMAAGRSWVWITGNHDPGPVDLPGSCLAELHRDGLVFRHIARTGAEGEISGHYHPKMRLVLKGQPVARKCFLADSRRIVLPAFGTYTGGLDVRDALFDELFTAEARAFLLGKRVIALPRMAAA